MDAERAIEHILDLQARAELRMDRAEARMDRAEERMDRTDRQIRGIQKLIQAGMKLIVRVEKQGREADARLEVKLAELAHAQLNTDRKLDKLIDLWLKHPPNGKR